MAVETKIKTIDNQGEGKKVLTDYQPHTISIVGEGALGINLTKVKSKNEAFLETEGGAKLMAKVEKAKALDAQAEAESQVEAEVTEAVEAPVTEPEATKEDNAAVTADEPENKAEEATEAPEAKDEGESAEPEAEDKTDEPKDKPEGEKVGPEVKGEQEAEPEAEAAQEQKDSDKPDEGEPANEVTVEEEGEATDKAKALTVDQLVQAQKDALDGIKDLFNKVKQELPDAEIWEVSDVIYSALYKVEDAAWTSKNSIWDEVWDEVFTEVSTRVNKAKSLKVETEGTKEDKIKSALGSLDPAMAKLIMAEMETNKAKALEAETARKAVIRAKALEQGAEKYKRIASEDNTTDMITDALMNLEIASPEDHKVIAKALETASLITMSGELFPDVGSSSSLQVETEEEYVTNKAKALVEKEGGNLAAARATVRGSEEFQTLYGK